MVPVVTENRNNCPKTKTTTLPCGCEYEDKGWMLTRVTECEFHKRRRTAKKPYKPKAECVRP